MRKLFIFLVIPNNNTNILLTKINSRYLGVTNGKTHNKLCNLYKKSEKMVGLSKIGILLGEGGGESIVNKIISFTFNG